VTVTVGAAWNATSAAPTLSGKGGDIGRYKENPCCSHYGKCMFCYVCLFGLQGDFYVTLAYSKEPGNLLMAPAEDSCQPVTIINDSNNNFTKPQLMQSSRTNSTPVAGQSFKNMFDDIFDVVAASPLLAEFTQAMKPYSSHRNAYYDYGETMFAGAALVFMGETSVTSLKNGVNVKQTGMH
jgi:hypothetical protein